MGAGCPFVCREVERHLHTQEAQIPAGEAICLAVAPPSEEPPAAGDLEAVVVRPGYVLVLHRAVWHSASHPVGGEGAYYWMAQAYENEPTLWAEVQGGPVEVVAP